MSSAIKNKLLNARELIAVSNLQNEIESTVLVRGLKATYPNNTDEERALIKSYQDDLRKVLSLERVVQKGYRSTASLKNGVIQIIKRTGKWEGFESTGTFLEPHEALFLMETNRLEVYMGKMIVSLERAYHLFLANDNKRNGTKLTKMEYLVYTHFIRFGCNLKRFKNEMPSKNCGEFSDSSDSVSDTDMDNNISDKLYVWNYLYDLLGHRRTILSSENIDRSRYTRIKQSMNSIINEYKDQNRINPCQSNQIVSDSNVSDESTEPPEKRRRKLSDSNVLNVERATKLPESKHRKNDSDDLYFGSGSLNDFMIGNTFQRFKQIFDKIDIIELKTMDYDEDDDHHNTDDNVNDGAGCNHNHSSTTEKFSFDLWTSWDSRRSQPTNPPNFRLIVKQPSKSLPHNDEIFRLYRSLICKSAIIVVCINEEMSFQAYVYRFTT